MNSLNTTFRNVTRPAWGPYSFFRPFRTVIATTFLVILGIAFPICAEVTVRCTVDRSEIGMGDSITLSSQVATGSAASPAGYRVIPFVNNTRWGAIETTDENGQTIHFLPLPQTGPMEIQVLVESPTTRHPQAEWIWGRTVPPVSTQYFQQRFSFSGDPQLARLFVAVDDSATVYLNGEELGTVSGWSHTQSLPGLSERLQEGENIVSVAATTKGGLAGLLLRLDTGSPSFEPLCLSNAAWHCFDTAPYEWPFLATLAGERATALATVEWSPYRRQMTNWPFLQNRALDMAATPKPDTGLFSKPLLVQVSPRKLLRPPVNATQRVGIQFEPWFTPQNNRWESSHGVPLTGFYWSWNPDVLRQQAIWLTESGIDFLVVDWTNNLWGKQHWDERGDHVNEIIHATTQLLETLATMREEGHPVPGIVLYLGLNNGPSTTYAAINESMTWIYHTYLRNPRFAGLFEELEGKPLLLLHNGGGPDWKDAAGEHTLHSPFLTVREQSVHHEFNDHATHGFWSWMDASLQPVPTPGEDGIEALTVSSAFFSQGGWKQPGSHGRRNGWTFLEGFRTALKYRPAFLQLHQYQEFAGQWEGFGYGEMQDHYVDSYDAEFSDEMEPVSRTATAYRSQGGWGFYYLNQLRALVDIYQQSEPESTLLLLSQPENGSTVSGDSLEIAWDWIGKSPTGFVLHVNGDEVPIESGAQHEEIDLGQYPAGPLTISVTARDAVSRYALAYDKASQPLSPMPPATTQLVCQLVKD